MPNLPNGTKGGFEPGLTQLRVRHSTTELPRSTFNYATLRNITSICTKMLRLNDNNLSHNFNSQRRIFVLTKNFKCRILTLKK